MQNAYPFLWFNNNVVEAMNFYVSVFPNSKIVESNPSMATVIINGMEVMLFNGGPTFKFTEAISLFVKCKDQAEVNNYWNKLTADGGEEIQCGWLKDKYGLYWQIIPNALGECLNNPDRSKADKAMQAMLKMKKIIIADLYKAIEE